MTIKITFGWWLLPLAVTIICFGWAFWHGGEHPGMYGSGVLFNLIVWLVALIPALGAWLIWAVLT